MATTTLQLTVTQVGDFDGRPRALLSGVAGSILVDVTREEARQLASRLYRKVVLTLDIDGPPEAGSVAR